MVAAYEFETSSQMITVSRSSQPNQPPTDQQNRPCLLTGVMDDWPALRKWRTPELFARAAAEGLAEGQRGEMTLHGGGLSFTVPEYANYAREAHHDDLPLYIFDRWIGVRGEWGFVVWGRMHLI